MADIVWDDVVDLQPNLADVSEGAQDSILAYVNEGLNPRAFGGEDSPRYFLARAYLAAHLGELARRNGQQGVSSESIGTGSISISYAAVNSAGDALLQTSWGGMYAALLAASPLRIGGGRCR